MFIVLNDTVFYRLYLTAMEWDGKLRQNFAIFDIVKFRGKMGKMTE